jgi:MinD-like ATPase involved in chromosome partitioning or flagellar assembly
MNTRMGDEYDGEVITFYSFKGGTGRSMAVANLGVLLASPKSSPVLMVDWDLEAPGLHAYFADRIVGMVGEEVGSHPGVVEIFTEIGEKMKQPRFSGSEEEVGELISSLKIQERFILPTTIPGLSIMTAGSQDGSYIDRIRQVDWQGLYQQASSIFGLFAHQLARSYRYVLVDSRTGITDISGICTSLLPSKLVVVSRLASSLSTA